MRSQNCYWNWTCTYFPNSILRVKLAILAKLPWHRPVLWLRVDALGPAGPQWQSWLYHLLKQWQSYRTLMKSNLISWFYLDAKGRCRLNDREGSVGDGSGRAHFSPSTQKVKAGEFLWVLTLHGEFQVRQGYIVKSSQKCLKKNYQLLLLLLHTQQALCGSDFCIPQLNIIHCHMPEQCTQLQWRHRRIRRYKILEFLERFSVHTASTS